MGSFPESGQYLGAVLYEGPSVLTGEPIVAILTGYGKGSQNAKTGNMLQTWILRADVEPVEAVQTGTDAAICGNCPLRGNFKERKYYVNVGQGPTQVYRAWKRGRYGIGPQINPSELFGQACPNNSEGKIISVARLEVRKSDSALMGTLRQSLLESGNC